MSSFLSNNLSKQMSKMLSKNASKQFLTLRASPPARRWQHFGRKTQIDGILYFPCVTFSRLLREFSADPRFSWEFLWKSVRTFDFLENSRGNLACAWLKNDERSIKIRTQIDLKLTRWSSTATGRQRSESSIFSRIPEEI